MARRSSKVTRSSKSAMKMDSLQMISWVLITLGAINWGLVGLFGVNLVESLFSAWPAVGQIIYILIGLAGVYSVWGMFSMISK